MDFITWTDAFSVGVEKFDDEHKQLIILVNNLNHALAVGNSHKTLVSILMNLVRYTVIHFKHEEEYMLLYDYPSYDAHKKQHDDLAAQVDDFHSRLQLGKASFSLELLTFLSDWLRGHIMGTDKLYKDFFASKGV